jgi:hypothetical protein
MKNILNIYISGSKLSIPLYDTQAYIFTWLLLQAYLSMTHTVCKHVKATHTYMYRRFEHVLSSFTNRSHAFQQTYLVKPPQILQPVALLIFRVEAIPMFLLTVPIQICQVKLVLCFTAWSSITNGECVHNFHK